MGICPLLFALTGLDALDGIVDGGHHLGLPVDRIRRLIGVGVEGMFGCGQGTADAATAGRFQAGDPLQNAAAGTEHNRVIVDELLRMKKRTHSTELALNGSRSIGRIRSVTKTQKGAAAAVI